MTRAMPFAATRLPLLIMLLIALGLPGCSSDGGIGYDSIYEGIFGDEPPPTPTQAVAMTFNRDDADQRRTGMAWLAASPFGGDDEYLATYRLFVDDPDSSVRATAASALGRHGTIDDAIILVTLLEDEESLVRWQAADALRKVHNPAAIAGLVQRLDPEVEEDADTRAAAAVALGQYADRVVFTRLVTALEDRSFTVVNAARDALILLTGHDAGLDPRDWSDWVAGEADPFANQKPYTFGSYHATRGWFDRNITFWNNEDSPPKAPKGLSLSDGQ